MAAAAGTEGAAATDDAEYIPRDVVRTTLGTYRCVKAFTACFLRESVKIL